MDEATVLVGIEEQTAVIRDGDGRWRVAGAGGASLWQGGGEVGLDQLP